MKNEININLKYGKLTLIDYIYSSKENDFICKCKCNCGNIRYVTFNNLKSKVITDCGCSLTFAIMEQYKQSKKRLRSIYNGMLRRCYSHNSYGYKYYGEKGIYVCSEWLGNNGFQRFYHWACQTGYADELTLDRKNPNKGYSPSNCRWKTIKEQQNNRKDNVFLIINGNSKTIAEWAELYGIPYKIFHAKLLNSSLHYKKRKFNFTFKYKRVSYNLQIENIFSKKSLTIIGRQDIMFLSASN